MFCTRVLSSSCLFSQVFCSVCVFSPLCGNNHTACNLSASHSMTLRSPGLICKSRVRLRDTISKCHPRCSMIAPLTRQGLHFCSALALPAACHSLGGFHREAPRAARAGTCSQVGTRSGRFPGLFPTGQMPTPWEELGV